MTSTTSRYTLNWQQLGNRNQALGNIYTQDVVIRTLDDCSYTVSFDVGDGRQLGLLFVKVKFQEGHYINTLNYCLGQFRMNKGAKLFAQFALSNFVNTETWDVCPSFEPIDWIDGFPHALDGTEIVSDLI